MSNTKHFNWSVSIMCWNRGKWQWQWAKRMYVCVCEWVGECVNVWNTSCWRQPSSSRKDLLGGSGFPIAEQDTWVRLSVPVCLCASPACLWWRVFTLIKVFFSTVNNVTPLYSSRSQMQMGSDPDINYSLMLGGHHYCMCRSTFKRLIERLC